MREAIEAFAETGGCAKIHWAAQAACTVAYVVGQANSQSAHTIRNHDAGAEASLRGRLEAQERRVGVPDGRPCAGSIRVVVQYMAVRRRDPAIAAALCKHRMCALPLFPVGAHAPQVCDERVVPSKQALPALTALAENVEALCQHDWNEQDIRVIGCHVCVLVQQPL